MVAVNELASNAGAAYVFLRNGTAWSQQAYLKAGQVSVGDFFGRAVAISGDIAVVGVPGEDGGSAGVNGPVNELAAEAGAACVFVRSGVTWSQQAYLKASQVTAGDQFGGTVGISGVTVVVGAINEDGSATGANGAVDELAADSGAVYAFGRSGTTWTQKAYLKATQVTAGDNFGRAAAIWEDTVVAGAVFEDSSATSVNAPVDELAPDSGAAYLIALGAPKMLVTQTAAVTDGGSVSFGAIVTGATGLPLTFTISNPGTDDLTSLVVTKDGPDSAAFTIGALSATNIPLGPGTVTFTVTFYPTTSGAKTAALHIGSNIFGVNNPYDINLTGTALSFTLDTDGDGLNDASELQMTALGFNWQVNQSALVNTYTSTANGAGYFNASQIQEMNLGMSLLQQNPATNQFKLELGLEKSTDLTHFTPFPFTAPQLTVRPDGKIEFLFTVPDNAAFFRLKGQ
jgi:hypothetical protein